MNKKDKLRKIWKGLCKHKEKISLGIVLGIAAAAVAFIAYGAMQIMESDRVREAEAAGMRQESPIAADRSRDYGEEGFRKVAENENYIMYADYTTGAINIEEKSTGKVWYSNPQDYTEDTIAASKHRLRSQLSLSYLDLSNKVEKTLESYNGSVTQGGMEHEVLEQGIEFCFSFPVPGIRITVRYTLEEDGFTATIPSDGIEELWSESYLVTGIELLPFFGAGGASDEGYLLVPDGSGVLIEFNNGKQRYQEYQNWVYGTDLALVQEEEPVQSESIGMPVFGLKCGDHAFLAIIESGDASSKIYAYTSKKVDSYNKVYSEAIYRQFQPRSNVKTGYSTNMLEGCDYTVRYLFLSGEEADYCGMSRVYQEYLTERNELKLSNLADKNYLILDLYGAVGIEQYVVGVEKDVITALTTYNEVCEIVKELKSGGVENLIINYLGASKGGLEGKAADGFSTESVLGTKAEFRKMVDYLNQEGVLLFIDTNPIYLYESGNGYHTKTDSIKTFFGEYAYQYDYSLHTKKSISSTRWYVLRAQQLPELLRSFTKSLISNGLENISISGIGEHLYSDFSDEHPSGRGETLKLWEQALMENEKEAQYLMVSGGNAYSFPYADIVTNVAASGSGYDVAAQDIPFYQMVLHGNIVTGATAINDKADYHDAFLKAIETGSSLKYDWLYADITELVRTEYNELVYASYEYWIDTVVEEYLALQEAVGDLAGQHIVEHRLLEDEVSMTVYESGTCVIVNYGQNEYRYGELTVAGRDYLVVEGEKQ